MENPIRIIITEDKAPFRQALRRALEDYGIRTIGEAANGKELLHLLETLSPNVILLDLQMPEMDGNAAMALLGERHPDKKVIVLSQHDEQVLIEDYLLRGARGYVSKDDITGDMGQLAAAIRKVHKGGRYVYRQREKEPLHFSVRQKEIIHLVSGGKSKKQIAEALGLSSSGVHKQKQKIMQKAGLGSLAELYCFIFEKGLKFFRGPLPKKPPGK